MKKIKAVIFDMDGVIVDTEQAYQERRKAFMASLGYPTDAIDWYRFIGETFSSLWHLVEPWVDISCQELQEKYVAYKKEHPLSYLDMENKEMVETILSLKEKGYLLGLASSSTKKDIQRCLEELQLTHVFQKVRSGEEFPKTKPHPAIYQQIIEDLGVSNEEAIAVEDSEVGITAAKKAGLTVIAYHQPQYGQDPSCADFIVRTPKEILSFITSEEKI